MSDFLVKIGYVVDSSEIKKAREEINKTNDSLGKTGKSADNASKKTSGGFKAAAIPIGGLTTAAVGAGAAIAGIGVAAVSAARVISSEFAKVQELNDLALFLGATNEQLAILDVRSTRAGVGIDNIGKTIQRQQEKIQQGSEVFEDLGLDVDRLASQDAVDAFQEIINALDNTSDQALRARGIIELLGEGEQDVLKLAASFAELEDIRNRAAAIGFSAEDLANADAFDDAMNSIAESALIFRRRLVEALGPSTVAAAENIAELLSEVFFVRDFEISQAGVDRLDSEIKRVASEVSEDNPILLNLEVQRDALADVARLQQQLAIQDEFIDEADGQAPPAILALRERTAENLVEAEQDLNDARRRGIELEDEKLDRKAEQRREAREETAEIERQNELLEQQRSAVSGFTSNIESVFRSFANSDALQAGITDPVERLKEVENVMSRLENRRIISDQDINSIEELRGLLLDNIGTGQFGPFLDALDRVTAGEGGPSLADRLFGSGGPEEAIQFLNDLVEASRDISEADQKRADAQNATKEFREKTTSELAQQEEIIRAINEGEIRNSDQLDRKIQQEEEITKLKALGVNLTEEEIEKRLEEIRANDQLIEDRLKAMEDFREFVEGTFEDVGDILSDSISDALIDGRGSFADFFADVGELLIRSGIQELIAQVFSPRGNNSSLAQGFLGSLFSGLIGGAATGGSSGGSGVSTSRGGFAKGEVFTGTQTGTFAEQGPEAVLPLGRDASGRLGVRVSESGSGSSGSSVVINNNVTVNGSDEPQETAERTSRALNQLMERKFKQMIIQESRSGNLLGGGIR